MEWFVLLAPVPTGGVELGVGSAAVTAAVTIGLVPIVLALRDALRFERATREVPALRVIDGRRELRPEAA